MIFYQITFGPYCKAKEEEADDHIESYLNSLCRNGQIARRYVWRTRNGEVVACVHAMEYDAHLLKFHSQWGKKHLRELIDFFGQKPVWTCDEDFPSKRKTTWKGAPFLYFVTDYGEIRTPLVRGDNAMSIPLYRVPVTDLERDEISSWMWRYKSLDNVWMGSCDLEMQAYQALAGLDSKCTEYGREHCLAIEKATGVPT